MDSVLSRTAEYARYEPWVGSRCFRLRNPCERVTWPNGAASPGNISRRSRTDSCSRGFPNRANAGAGVWRACLRQTPSRSTPTSLRSTRSRSRDAARSGGALAVLRALIRSTISETNKSAELRPVRDDSFAGLGEHSHGCVDFSALDLPPGRRRSIQKGVHT
jgi:hypothetical protein